MLSPRITFSLICLALIPVGCQSPASPKAAAPSASPKFAASSSAHPFDSVYGDPCADRVQSIGGALFEYYIDHKRLPDRLDQLRTYSDIGASFQFTCPVSGLPYVYSVDGLLSPAGNDRLVLYDAAPSHEGMRYVLFFKRDAKNNLVTWPRLMPEGEFRTYIAVPNSPPLIPTTAPGSAGG